MAYIARLARRLARLRASGPAYLFSMPSLLAIAACAAGEPTGISTGTITLDLPDAPIVVNPRRMTLEGTQGAMFRAFESDLSTQVTSIEWTATGGSMGADGSYSSTTTGNFRVVGKRLGNPHNAPDTSVVTVVPVQPTLAGVVITPSGATVIGGQQQQFTASGVMTDSSTVAIGVTWAASGGTIDAGGMFRAGNSAGTFHVIATHVTTGIADTVPVTVRAVQNIALTPSTASLWIGGTQGFSVAGTLADGSSTPLPTVSYSTTGGTISTTGVYMAPATAGTYRVIAKLSGTNLADTSTVTVTGNTALTFSGPGHEPDGFTKIFSTPFTALLSTTKNSEGWFIQSGYSRFPTNTTIVTDGSAPESPASVLNIRYETSLSGGTSPTVLFYGGPVPANHGYLYQRVQLKIDPNWSDNGNSGTKWGFFKTKGYTNNHGWGVTYYNAHKIRVFTQFNDQTSANREWVMTNPLQKGVWYTVELLIEPGTPGQFNGTLRGWVDGNVISWTRNGIIKTLVDDMMWFESGQTPYWDNIYWDGTYGGGLNQPPYTMYVWCDHWYASTR